MNVRALLTRLNVLQRSRRYKLVASSLVLAIALIAFIAWVIAVNAPDSAAATQAAVERAAEQQTQALAAQARARGFGGDSIISAVLRSPSPIVPAAVAILLLSAITLAAIWLGISLSLLAIAALAAAVSTPLLLFPASRSLGQMALAASALAAAFTVLLQALRALLSLSNPVNAIARNVLAEAARLKISVIFIVMLVFLLVALPFLLDEQQPLRYRIQTFLQYSTAGSYWVLALLTALFSVATVAFEQRDRVIWQTMTKPVSPARYVLGKWLGICALNAALLTVAASGIFLFTQYLRAQPAVGEVSAFVAADGSGPVSEDRRLLESQVLVARRVAIISLNEAFRPEELERETEARYQEFLAQNPGAPTLSQTRNVFRRQALEELLQQHRTIEPGEAREFVFSGLRELRSSGRPFTLRYSFNSGSNNPSTLYRVTFVIGNLVAFTRQAALSTAQTVTIPDDLLPRTLPIEQREAERRQMLSDVIDEQGRLSIQIINGDPQLNLPNQFPMTFPPDGLQILYVDGSYETNFFRVALILWCKLALIAAIGVAAGTFLAFPVASLTTLASLFILESSAFLRDSLEDYQSVTEEGLDIIAFLARLIAVPINLLVGWYADLTPTSSLADGIMVPWAHLIRAAILLAAVAAAALTLGWLVFRKRELATYSGK
ncbi:MAG: ABC transporter permease [Phycisphaerales bacterium]